MTTTTLAADERADARFHEEIAAHYRDYVAYLEAQLTLLDIQAARMNVAFERAEAREDEEQAARAAIAAIAPQRRTLFATIVEQERQEAQHQLETQARSPGERARHADPDEAARIALTLLRDEALGVGTEGGKGLLPRGKPDAIKWYAVDVAALRAAPTAAAYAVGASDSHARRRMVWQAGAAIAVILVALIWLFIPKGSQYLPRVIPHVATANGTTLSAWPIQAIVLTAAHGDPVTLPISATTASIWPALTETPPRAYWRSTSVWPLRLCVPGAILTDLTNIQLLGSGAIPSRTYTLLPTPAPAIDLVLEPCQSEKAAPAARAAVLSATAAITVHAVGETAALLQGSIALTAITVTGPGEDQTLPSDQARVTVRVQTSLKPDWPLLAPTLLLPSGEAALPSDITTMDSGAELSYLIPLPSEPLDVAWSIAPPADASLIRWRTTFEVPPSRAAVLRDALEVGQVQAARGEAPGTIVATITVANRGHASLLLMSADITLIANNRPLATPDLATLRRPLAPGEQRTLAVTAPLGERNSLILSVGVARFAIEAAGGGR